MPLSPAKLHHALLLRLGAALALVCSCLPEDDLASHSRAWTSEPEALLPASPAPARDAGASEDASAAAAPSDLGASPGEAPPEDDVGAPREDAGEPLDGGADAALEIADSSAPPQAEPPPPDDDGVASDAGL